MKQRWKDRIESSLFLQDSSIGIKVTKNLWLRSVLQAIPYIGLLLDNLLMEKGVRYQEARIEKFLSELAEDIERPKGLHPIAEELESEDAYFLLLRTVDQVRREKSKSITTYYRNLLLSYSIYGRADGLSSIDVVPEMYLRALDVFTEKL